MNDTVTNPSTAISHCPNPPKELLSPLSLQNRISAVKDSLGWFYPLDPTTEPSFENWHPSSTENSRSVDTSRYPSHKLLNPDMPARTTDNSDRVAAHAGSRWKLDGNGNVVDIGTESDLADEISRLKIGDVTADADDARVTIRTPPKSKLAANVITQISESSPLDSSSSNTSVGSPPHVHDHQISHSRGSSADTTLSSSRDSMAGNAVLVHPLKQAAPAEAKERPHSFSGGLPSADLRRLQQVGDSDHDRLQQQQWAQNHNAEQLTYPSLTNQVHRPVPQQQFTYPPNAQGHPSSDRDREDGRLDYNAVQQQRTFAAVPPHINHGLVMNAGAPSPPQSAWHKPTNSIPAMNYRQAPRSFAPQGPNPSLGYPGGHTSHLSLGNTQQLYEMMLPGPPPHDNHHPAVARVQQQHNVFRATHHHSASDPSTIRDAATLALLNNNMQSFNPNMFQPNMPPPAMSLYANQYYGAQELAVQQVMAARLQAQYTGSYNVAATPAPPVESDIASPTSSSGQTGPSANNRKLGLYKTELCRSWEEKGSCRYGGKCQFAHGEDELRKVSRHPKYKTEICKTFWVSGSCPYGKRCCFIHTEVSSAGTPASAGTSDNASPQPPDGRERSNSETDASASISLLARISHRSQQDSSVNATLTPVDMNSTNGFQFTRPPMGTLRVDTAVDVAPMKQNKSAYPTFASNGILLPAAEHITAKSPAPVTAGPDLGRHNLARMEIVGYSQHQKKNSTSSMSNSHARHSFSGPDVDFSPSPPASGHAYGRESPQPGPSGPPRVNGHVRAGSAGNWGAYTRSSHLSTSAYPHSPSPAGEIMSNSPWSSTELAVGSSRLHEKTWA